MGLVAVDTDYTELLDNFAYHPPSSEAVVEKHGNVRQAAMDFAVVLASECPPSRHRSLALTAVEEAMHWGNAAIAIHQD